MALTNIELYEALKKDVSEDSARMIAEVVPKASDLATKQDIADLRQAISEFRGEMLDRFAAADRRLLRYLTAFGAPLWAAFIAALVKIVLEL